MFRSTFVTSLFLGCVFATLGMAAVSEYGPVQVLESDLITDAQFEKVVAEPVVLAAVKDVPDNRAHEGAEEGPVPAAHDFSGENRTFSSIKPENYLHWNGKDRSYTHTYHVRLNPDGMLKGRVILLGSDVGPGPTTITFVKAGTIFSTVQSTPNGDFQSGGIIPGVYGVLVRGERSFAAFSIHVFDSVAQGKQAASLELTVFAVPAQHVPVILSIFETALHRETGAIPLEPADENIPEYAKITPEVVDDADVLKENVNTFVTNADGSFSGHLRRLHPVSGRSFLMHPFTNRVYFVQGDSIVYSADVEADGRFIIPDFNPGIYSIVTAGEDGVGAVGIRVRAPENDFNAGIRSLLGGYQFVSLAQPANGPVFDFSMVGPENYQALNQLLAPAEFAQLMQAVPAGGGAGGGGAGGGGGGSGVGAGGAGGAAALGLLGLLGLLASP